MVVDKGLLNCAFKGEWDLFRKRGKGRSKIIIKTISSISLTMYFKSENFNYSLRQMIHVLLLKSMPRDLLSSVVSIRDRSSFAKWVIFKTRDWLERLCRPSSMVWLDEWESSPSGSIFLHSTEILSWFNSNLFRIHLLVWNLNAHRPIYRDGKQTVVVRGELTGKKYQAAFSRE